MTYHWIEFEDLFGEKWTGLLPVDEPNPWSLHRIASIYRRPDGMYCGAFCYSDEDMPKRGSWVVQKTRRGCQRWIERKLRNFWEPPHIENALTA